MKIFSFNTWKLLLSVLLVVNVLAGCGRGTQMSSTYSFAHPIENIASIDLLINNSVDAFSSDENAFVLIRSLDVGEIEAFMTAVYEIKTSYCVSPPLRGYGQYIAKVTYINGDVEMLGTRHIEYIQVGNEPTGVGAYYFAGDAIEQLILKYGNLRDSG